MSGAANLLRQQVGVLRHSDWLLVDQAIIDRFAEATLDRQFIHVDPVKAKETPFGGTIAHGFLTLSLLSHLQESIADFGPLTVKLGVNYGFDRIRFVAPVRSGRHVRLASTLVEVEEKGAAHFQLTHDVTMDIRDEAKPALHAVWITRLSF